MVLADGLLEPILTRLINANGNSWRANLAADGVRNTVRDNPNIMQEAVQEWLDKNNLALTPKGQLTMTTEQELCCEIKAMMPEKPGGSIGYGAGFNWRSIIKKVLMLIDLFFPDDAAEAGPFGHVIMHNDDPFDCVMIVVDSSKELAERGCAAADLLFFASKTFLPHGH